MSTNVAMPTSPPSTYRLYDAPYVEGKRHAPRTANTLNLFQLLQQTDASQVIGLVLAVFGGLLYLCFSPIFDFIGYVRSLIMSSNKDPSAWCKTDHHSSGIISEFKCPKTGRTYITRFIDTGRDVSDCSQLLLNAFNRDPFTTYLQPNIRARHSYGMSWYKFFFESPSYDVVVQEWKEEEKIVGVLVYNQRKHSNFQELIDYSKVLATCIRFMFIDPRTSYMHLLMGLAMEHKFHHVCESMNLKDVIHAKFLAVEKGFQGMGIGSNLLRSVSSHADALTRHAYLESSNIDNVPLYERFNFRTIEEWSICPGCPPLYLMVRVLPGTPVQTVTGSDDESTVAAESPSSALSLSPVLSNVSPTSTLSSSVAAEASSEVRQRH